MGDRLVPSPVFLLSSVRSGSTLLRVMLNSHSQICAPHELHLAGVIARAGETKHSADAMAELGLTRQELQFLLWDRVLSRALTNSGKSVLVEKTPANVFRWRKLHACWPDARYIILLRHPASMAASWRSARKKDTDAEVVEHIRKYTTALDRARRALPGITVRYEDVTENPERELRRICDYLGVPFEAGMLDYSGSDQSLFRHGMGDWSRKLKSGRVQQARPLPRPEDVPAELVAVARAWGYLD